MKKIIPIFLFVLAMATSAQGGIVVLDYGSAGGDNETMINRLIDADHADNNATGAGTRTDQSVTPAGLKSTIGVLFPGIDPSLTNDTVVCVNSSGKIGDCSNLTWDGNEMGLNGGILLGGKARIASGENYIVRIADGANASGLKWYYFLTDATNYQYGYLSAGSDYVKVSADSNGTGADNIDVLLSPKGTGVIGNADKSFQVDADGDLTAKSVSVTRGDWPGFTIIYEPTSGGDDYWKWKTSDNQTGPVVNITPLDNCSANQVLRVASVDGDNQTWECVTPATLTGTETLTNKTLTTPVITALEVFIDCNGTATPYSYCTSANASTLTATQVSRTIINSYGRGEAQTVTLPTATAGETFIVVVGTQHDSAFTIAKGASDLYWETAGVPTAVAAFLETNQVVGSRASCATFKTGAAAWSWLCGSVSGTWTTTAL